MSELGTVLSSQKQLLVAGPDGALLPRQGSVNESAAEREVREMELFALGRLMGVALIKRVPLPVGLSRSVYKVLLGERITAFDVARIDPTFARHRVMGVLKAGGVAEMEAVLCDELKMVGVPMANASNNGGRAAVEPDELFEGGRNVRVTEKNKKKYIQLLVEHYLIGHCRSELAILVEGFYDLVPKRVLRGPKERKEESSSNATSPAKVIAGLQPVLMVTGPSVDPLPHPN